jgi:hypothetical protein
MKPVTRELIYLYHPREIDWMGYELRSITDLTYHHIVKKEHGGKLTLDNGALLRGDTAHEYLHIIEGKDLDMYIYINNLLKTINTQGYNPTKRQLLAVRAILEQFEREHCSDRTSKGKPLIRTKYIEGRKKL